MKRYQEFSPPVSRRSRAGFTLVEMIVAGIVLTVVMTVSLQLLAGFSKQQRLSNRRQLAAAELANVMERITAQPFAAVTTEAAQSISLSEPARSGLPDAVLKIEVSAQPGSPPGKRIQTELRWRNGSEQRSAPVRLVAWMFPQSGGKP